VAEHDYETEGACLDEVLVRVEESDLLTLLGTLDRLRRQNAELQACGTELLERARAAEAERDNYQALHSVSDANHSAAIQRYEWSESEMARAAEVCRSVADGMRSSFMHRGAAEDCLRKLAADLDPK
jgi:hypothetical protein